MPVCVFEYALGNHETRMCALFCCSLSSKFLALQKDSRVCYRSGTFLSRYRVTIVDDMAISLSPQ